MRGYRQIKYIFTVVFLAFLASFTFAQYGDVPKECLINPDKWKKLMEDSSQEFLATNSDLVFVGLLPGLLTDYSEISKLTEDIDSFISEIESRTDVNYPIADTLIPFYSRLFAATILDFADGDLRKVLPALRADGVYTDDTRFSDPTRLTLQLVNIPENNNIYLEGGNVIEWFPLDSMAIPAAAHEWVHLLDAFNPENPEQLSVVDGVIWSIQGNASKIARVKTDLDNFFIRLDQAYGPSTSYLRDAVSYYFEQREIYDENDPLIIKEGIAIYLELKYITSITGCESLLRGGFDDFPELDEILTDAIDLSMFADLDDSSKNTSRNSIESW